MAVNLFKISGLSVSINNTKYETLWYRSDGNFYTAESDGTSVTSANAGLEVATSLNPDGTRTVTVSDNALGVTSNTANATTLSNAKISIEDLNNYDRQGFRLALQTNTNYGVGNNRYGGTLAISRVCW